MGIYYTPKIDELSARVRKLEAKLPLSEREVVELHPQAAARYKAMVAGIQALWHAGTLLRMKPSSWCAASSAAS
jgi:predicted nuclease with RNAse H fold